MADRYGGRGFRNYGGRNRGNPHSFHYTSSRGTHGGADQYEYNYFIESRRGNIPRSRLLPSSSGYDMNRSSESYWPAQGNSYNNESRYYYSGYDDRYSGSYNEGGRSHIDSDMTRYSSSGYSGGTSYIGINTSPNNPNNWESNNYIHRGNLIMRMQLRNARYSQSHSSYSNPSYIDMNARRFRVDDRPVMRGTSSANGRYPSNRNSYRNRSGLIKLISSGRTNGNKKGFNKAKERKHTFKSKENVKLDHNYSCIEKSDDIKEKSRACLLLKNNENLQDIDDEEKKMESEPENKTSLGTEEIEAVEIQVVEANAPEAEVSDASPMKIPTPEI